MKRMMLMAAALTMFAACTFDYDDDYNGPAYVVHSEPAITVYEVESCFEEPPWYEPEWCEHYDDVSCCVWYVDGWHDEWCIWEVDWCWEYNGSW